MGHKSGVWLHVTRINSSQVECRNCSKILKRSGNTTNFWNHLRRHGIYKSTVSKEKIRKTSLSSENEKQRRLTFVDSILEMSGTDGTCEERKDAYDDNESCREHLLIQNKTNKISEKFASKVRAKPHEDHTFIRYPEDSTSDDNLDDCAIFGSFIINEMRHLSSSHLRKVFKTRVLQALIDTSNDDDGGSVEPPLVDSKNAGLNNPL